MLSIQEGKEDESVDFETNVRENMFDPLPENMRFVNQRYILHVKSECFLSEYFNLQCMKHTQSQELKSTHKAISFIILIYDYVLYMLPMI